MNMLADSLAVTPKKVWPLLKGKFLTQMRSAAGGWGTANQVMIGAPNYQG